MYFITVLHPPPFGTFSIQVSFTPEWSALLVWTCRPYNNYITSLALLFIYIGQIMPEFTMMRTVESDGLSQNWLIIWELEDLKSRLSKLANKYFSEDFEVCIVLINGFKQWFPFPLSENSSLTKILIYENQYFTSATLQLHYLSTTYLI